MREFILGNGALLLTSFIWGTAFVAQVTGMDLIGPFTFNASRCFLSAIFVYCLILFQNKNESINSQSNKKLNKNLDNNFFGKNKDLLISGVACGVFLFLGSSCQQVGLLYTSAGKTSFITSLYIVIVPLVGIFFKKKVNLNTWLAVFLGTIGLYLLAISNLKTMVINRGDLLVFIGAFFWTGHILVIDHFSKKVSPLKLSCSQFIVTGILSIFVSIIFEAPDINNIFLSWKAISYAGILSGGIAYTLQMVGQKHTTNTALASLILSLESVFGALAGFFILGERLTEREILGCIIMFGAIIIAQIPTDFFRKNKKNLIN